MKKILVGIICLVILTSIVGLVIASGPSPQTGTTTAGVTVNEFLSVTLNNAPVTFPNMDPGETTAAEVGPPIKGYPLTATVGGESNVNPNVKTRADTPNFGGAGTFAVSQMKWDNTDSPFVGTGYTTSDATVCATVSAGSDCDIYHQLTILANQAAGVYSVGITITATTLA